MKFKNHPPVAHGVSLRKRSISERGISRWRRAFEGGSRPRSIKRRTGFSLIPSTCAASFIRYTRAERIDSEVVLDVTELHRAVTARRVAKFLISNDLQIGYPVFHPVIDLVTQV